jgi:hypothetical protein
MEGTNDDDELCPPPTISLPTTARDLFVQYNKLNTQLDKVTFELRVEILALFPEKRDIMARAIRKQFYFLMRDGCPHDELETLVASDKILKNRYKDAEEKKLMKARGIVLDVSSLVLASFSTRYIQTTLPLWIN